MVFKYQVAVYTNRCDQQTKNTNGDFGGLEAISKIHRIVKMYARMYVKTWTEVALEAGCFDWVHLAARTIVDYI
jgi:hypothetical protein